ncbi:MAG: PepSY-associated TM helix domain-containing protein [Spirosomataceae bacterium]
MKFKLSDKTVFAWHKWLGLFVGIFTLFLSITGTLLLFTDEIDAAFAPATVKVQPGQNRLPLDTMLAVLQRTYPQALLRETRLNSIHSDQAIVTELSLNNETQWVYWDPYTNQITGARKTVFMKEVLEWHEELTVGEFGHLFLFFVGLALLGSVVTGLWYYRKSLLKVFKIGVRTRNTYLFNADLHKLLGVSSCLFLLLMGGTGTFFHWEKIERMMGEEGEAPRLPEVTAVIAPPPLSQVTYSLDRLTDAASKHIAGFTPEVILYPQTDESIVIEGNRPESVRLLGKFNSSAVLDTKTSELKEIKHREDGDLEQTMERSFEQLHYGQYGGFWSKIIYALGGLCLATLSITGFVIWLKKK